MAVSCFHHFIGIIAAGHRDLRAGDRFSVLICHRDGHIVTAVLVIAVVRIGLRSISRQHIIQCQCPLDQRKLRLLKHCCLLGILLQQSIVGTHRCFQPGKQSILFLLRGRSCNGACFRKGSKQSNHILKGSFCLAIFTFIAAGQTLPFRVAALVIMGSMMRAQAIRLRRISGRHKGIYRHCGKYHQQRHEHTYYAFLQILEIHSFAPFLTAFPNIYNQMCNRSSFAVLITCGRCASSRT